MKKAVILGLAIAAPSVALAQTVGGILALVKTWIDFLLPVLVTLALLGFFWGLVQYIWGGAESKEKGRDRMIWGVIALFVMVSVWGLVALIGNTFGIQRGGTTTVPGVQQGSGSNGSVNVTGTITF